MYPIRIFIADDHQLIREGLKRLFAQAKEIIVCGEAGNGTEILERLPQSQVDLLLLDMAMPGSRGEELIERIRAAYPALPILVLSMHDEPQIAQRALLAGASGYITKHSEAAALLDAVRKVAVGICVLDRNLAGYSRYPPKSSTTPHDRLSKRELQILRIVAGGLSTNETADKLQISNRTVSTHKKNMMEKMGFSSNADIVKYALAYDLTGE